MLVPFLVATSSLTPTEFQVRQAERYVPLRCDLYRVRRTTWESWEPEQEEEISSMEWYLIAAASPDRAVQFARDYTSQRYIGDWLHEHVLEMEEHNDVQ
jgi:hypothetical protein